MTDETPAIKTLHAVNPETIARIHSRLCELETEAHRCVGILEGEIADLKQRLWASEKLATELQRVLSYVTYQRLPVGDQVFDHLEKHWKLKVTQLLSQCRGVK